MQGPMRLLKTGAAALEWPRKLVATEAVGLMLDFPKGQKGSSKI